MTRIGQLYSARGKRAGLSKRGGIARAAVKEEAEHAGA